MGAPDRQIVNSEYTAYVFNLYRSLIIVLVQFMVMDQQVSTLSN